MPTRAATQRKSLIRLEDVLYRSPRAFGYVSEAWSVALVRDYLTRELGMALSEDEVVRRLRAVYQSMAQAYAAATASLPSLPTQLGEADPLAAGLLAFPGAARGTVAMA